MIRPLLLTFIPLFVAVDVVAVVLVYLGIGMPLDETARRRLVLEATMTAAAMGLGFLLVGGAALGLANRSRAGRRRLPGDHQGVQPRPRGDRRDLRSPRGDGGTDEALTGASKRGGGDASAGVRVR